MHGNDRPRAKAARSRRSESWSYLQHCPQTGQQLRGLLPARSPRHRPRAAVLTSRYRSERVQKAGRHHQFPNAMPHQACPLGLADATTALQGVQSPGALATTGLRCLCLLNFGFQNLPSLWNFINPSASPLINGPKIRAKPSRSRPIKSSTVTVFGVSFEMDVSVRPKKEGTRSVNC